jgi:tripartite-type tricarboxylate transporter receptor subunit TctC
MRAMIDLNNRLCGNQNVAAGLAPQEIRMHRRTLALAAIGAALLAGAAHAQDRPPLKILVGFPPGGSADVIARLVAEAVRDDFSPAVVENRPGASGRIALTAAKNARPDGQTVIILPSGPMVLFPHIYKKLDYDAVKDFTPVSLLARFQFGVVSGPASNVKSVAEMLAKAKADPQGATYGSAGSGSLPHFMGVMMEQATGVPLRHIPFQGSSPANTALLGGHVGYKFDVVSETAELHHAGKVRIIGVTGSKRDPQVPEVPTLKEQGIPMEVTAFFAMYAPAGLPRDVLARLEKAVGAAVHKPALQERLLKLGYEPVGSGSAELAAAQKADLTRWEKPIKATGITLD